MLRYGHGLSRGFAMCDSRKLAVDPLGAVGYRRRSLWIRNHGCLIWNCGPVRNRFVIICASLCSSGGRICSHICSTVLASPAEYWIVKN